LEILQLRHEYASVRSVILLSPLAVAGLVLLPRPVSVLVAVAIPSVAALGTVFPAVGIAWSFLLRLPLPCLRTLALLGGLAALASRRLLALLRLPLFVGPVLFCGALLAVVVRLAALLVSTADGVAREQQGDHQDESAHGVTLWSE
jgi:hypothetical protein